MESNLNPTGEASPGQSQSILEAQARRDARRKRILEKSEERMRKIVGPNAEISPTCRNHDETEPVLPEEFITLEALQNQAKVREEKLKREIPDSAYGNRNSNILKYSKLFPLTIALLVQILNLNYGLIYFLLFKSTTYLTFGIPLDKNSKLYTVAIIFGFGDRAVNRFRYGLDAIKWFLGDFIFFFMGSIGFYVLKLYVPQIEIMDLSGLNMSSVLGN